MEYLENLERTLDDTLLEDLISWKMEEILTARKIAEFYIKNREKVNNAPLTPHDHNRILEYCNNMIEK